MIALHIYDGAVPFLGVQHELGADIVDDVLDQLEVNPVRWSVGEVIREMEHDNLIGIRGEEGKCLAEEVGKEDAVAVGKAGGGVIVRGMTEVGLLILPEAEICKRGVREYVGGGLVWINNLWLS